VTPPTRAQKNGQSAQKTKVMDMHNIQPLYGHYRGQSVLARSLSYNNNNNNTEPEDFLGAKFYSACPADSNYSKTSL